MQPTSTMSKKNEIVQSGQLEASRRCADGTSTTRERAEQC